MEASLSPCREDCTYWISRQFDKAVFGGRPINNAFDTLNYFASTGLRCVIFIPMGYLFFPGYIRLAVTCKKNVIFNKGKFLSQFNKIDNFALLYHLTAWQLYRMSETWSHCVCEYWNRGQREYWDPLQRDDEFEIPMTMQMPTHNRLINNYGVVMLILPT